MAENQHILSWLKEVSSWTKPKDIIWINGTDEQTELLKKEACRKGELIKLNEELLPNCYLHYTAHTDVARLESRTFLCTKNKQDAGPTNNWVAPKEMYQKLGALSKNVMAGKTLYVIPYSLGEPNTSYAKYGIELTDSLYVVLNMLTLSRVGNRVLEALGDSSDFNKGFHATANLDESNRYIAHFPEDNAIVSINSCYGGNAIFSRNCFALRIASYLGRQEGWLAEHMMIIGVEYPDGTVKYIAAAFPSACGKNLAMMVPPYLYRQKGYRIWCVGDDVAWLHVNPKDGRLYAMNPVMGFFGVAPGTNEKTNPNALHMTKRDTIFTNVVHDTKNNTVWWEGLNSFPPRPGEATDWKGNPWDSTKFERRNKSTYGAHPNSRYTSMAKNCPAVSLKLNKPQGVPIDAIIFGVRRAKTDPLVYESFDWQHGVFLGSSMASEIVANASGIGGIVRRDPMAMRPFLGYDMGDFFNEWLKLGTRMTNPPKIFRVNWFRTDASGHFLWPGFNENIRVLLWILDRTAGKADAVKTPVGLVPTSDGIPMDGLRNLSVHGAEELFSINKEALTFEIQSLKDFYSQLGERVPAAMFDELNALSARLENK